nr:phospholipase D1 ScoTox-betaI isoform X8 [Hemiscorpius lepturus]
MEMESRGTKSPNAAIGNRIAATMRGLPLGIIFLAVAQVLGKEKDGRHPIYIIAHMVNSIREVDDYLRRGANAIETDVKFDYNAAPEATYHGHPCDCFRVCTRKESFTNFISYIRNITTPGRKDYKEELTLLFLDLKTSGVAPQRKYSAGVNLAKALMKHLWNGGDNMTSINLLISIGHTYDSQVIRGVVGTLKGENLDYLLPKIGFDVGLNDDPLKIERMWKSLGMSLNKWQGDGITNCLFPMRSTRRLQRYLIMKRDGENYMSKLYQWTVDFTVSFRKSLGLGVEAFITNYPERLRSVLEESRIHQHYRLATIDDDCWVAVPTYPSVITDLTAVQPISSKVYSVAQEVVDSLATFVGDAFNITQGMSTQEYAPLVKYLMKIDRAEDTQIPNNKDFCQYSLCSLYELYGRSSPPRLSFDTECTNKINTPGIEIKTICTYLLKLVHQ